jgi:hypothetical protein
MVIRKPSGPIDFSATAEWSGGEARGHLTGFVLGRNRVGLGVSRLVREERMLPPTPQGPVSSTDFLYAPTEALAGGEAGRWKMFFPPAEKSSTPADLEPRVRRALEAAGLSDQVARLEVARGRWGLLEAPHLLLEMKPEVRRSATEIHASLSAVWPANGPPLPGITVSFDAFAGHRPAPANSAGLISTLITQHPDGRISFGARLDQAQHNLLSQWAKSAGIGAQAKSDFRRLAGLMRADTNLETEGGRAAWTTLAGLGLVPPVISEGLTLLARHFGADALAGQRTFYNGHATFPMIGLTPALRALGAKACHLWLSNHSGTVQARELLRLQAPSSLRSDAPEDLLKVNDCIHDLLAKDRAPLIVDKGRNVLEILRLDQPNPTFIHDGRLRFVVHNRDDGLSPELRREAWGVDLANSLVKKLEARFIGEQYALIGAREAREKLKTRIGDTPTVIIGFGLLGEQLARALVRVGMDPAQIRVVERDPAVRARAARLGFTVESLATRPPQAVVYVATAGLAVDTHNVGTYADESVVIALTSGGKGVALSGPSEAGREHPTAGGILRDRCYTLSGSTEHQPCRVHLISDGHPPNLADPMWHDRYSLTCLAVTAAMAQAGTLEGPGIDPLRADVDLALVRMARRQGLWRMRPLEARAHDDVGALQADLQAFAPKAGRRPRNRVLS